MRKAVCHRALRRRKAKLVKTLAYTLLVFLSAGYAQAQSISGVSGTAAHGDTLTITGTGFGTKGNAAPVAYDDFSSGDFDPSFNISGSLEIDDNDVGLGPDIYCAVNNFNGDGLNRSGFLGKDGVSSPIWYCQYSFKLDAATFHWGTTGAHCEPWQLGIHYLAGYTSNAHYDGYYYFCIVTHDSALDNRPGTGANWKTYWTLQGVYSPVLTNTKILRPWSGNGGLHDYMAVQINSPEAPGYEYSQIYSSGGCGRNDHTGTNSQPRNWTKGVWHTIQWEYKQNSAANVQDGFYHSWVDGKLTANLNNTSAMRCWNYPNDPGMQMFHVGWWDTESCPQHSDNYWYMDNAYIDTTWSRVEIGDNITYNNCTHREIQIPVGWNNNEISVSMNLGSFNSAEETYLFVVSSTGAVSQGYALGSGDHAPILDPIGPQSVPEGATLVVSIRAMDPDGDSLVLSATGLPRNANFGDYGNGTGSLSFSPAFDQAGVYTVTVLATDGTLTHSEVLAIEVIDDEGAPGAPSVPWLVD
jgi:hypothetical protein